MSCSYRKEDQKNAQTLDKHKIPLQLEKTLTVSIDFRFGKWMCHPLSNLSVSTRTLQICLFHIMSIFWVIPNTNSNTEMGKNIKPHKLPELNTEQMDNHPFCTMIQITCKLGCTKWWPDKHGLKTRPSRFCVWVQVC